ncbi:hypothetical protein FCV25MIE_33669 [Fagus crenata]
MAEELVEEWRKFSLTEDEGAGFTVEEDAMGNSLVQGSHCLLGKLITDKPFNKVALTSTMLRLWGVARGTTAQIIGDNLFIFQFKDEFERTRVLNGSPWLFNNYLLTLNEFNGSCPAAQIQFSKCCFWVQLHGIPLNYMMEQTGQRLGNAMGKVVKVDVPEGGVAWGPYLRIRLCLHFTKPIPRGRLGATISKQYGPWLRAAEPSQRRRPAMQGHGAVLGGHMFSNLNLKLPHSPDFVVDSCDNDKMHAEVVVEGGVPTPQASQLPQDDDMGGCASSYGCRPLLSPSSPRHNISHQDGGIKNPFVSDKVEVAGTSMKLGISPSFGGVRVDTIVENFSVMPQVDQVTLHGENVSVKVDGVDSSKVSCGASFVSTSSNVVTNEAIQSKATKKKSWKCLARDKGKQAVVSAEGLKRGVFSSGLLLEAPEKKRTKLNGKGLGSVIDGNYGGPGKIE